MAFIFIPKTNYMRVIATTCILALATISCQKTKTEETTITKTGTIEKTETLETAIAGKQCYLSVTGKDSIVFEMEHKGDSVHGIFNVLPYEKDKRRSTFKGVLNGNSGIALGRYSAEGMDYTEELHFTVSDSTVSVNFGPTKQGKDGIYRYVNKDDKKYMHLIPKTDCKNK